MAENYCGKDCSQCSFKDALACHGCKLGPGRTFGGDCEIAKCCRERGHDTCDTCNHKGMCGKHRGAEAMADYRQKKQRTERERREKIEKHVPVLAKCLPFIFWLMIIGILPGLLVNDFTEGFPVLHLTGEILNLILNMAVVALYFCLGKVNTLYKKSAIFAAVMVIADFSVQRIFGTDTAVWVSVSKIPLAIIGFVSEYYKYVAHSEILVAVDYDLSEKWIHLWKWRIRLLVAMLAGLVLMLILSVLGALAVFAASIGILVVTIKELIYLHQMSELFRTYAQRLEA